jgi:dephospho-CoA kinase
VSPRPVTLAITGGIGAGKSEALAAFARHGAATLSADAVVHELIAGDGEVRAALEERFGTTDRGEIGSVVFAEPDELVWLEALLHPHVRTVTDRWLDEVDASVAVVEIPLLYEAGRDGDFDRVIVVTAPAEVRRGRSRVARDSREARLLPDADKVARADYVYENVGSLDDLDRFVASVLAELA